MINLVLVRHGETTGKSSERLYGKTDIALSNLGQDQMQMVYEKLKNENFDHVLVSPLQRSKSSAKIILNNNNLKPLVIEDFTEINFGDWEGLTIPEVEQAFPDTYKAWKQEGLNFSFPAGDSKKQFFNRIKTAAIREFNSYEGNILAVLHKGVIKGIISALTNTTIEELNDFPIELGSIHRLKKIDNRWLIIKSNDIGHLGKFRIPSSA